MQTNSIVQRRRLPKVLAPWAVLLAVAAVAFAFAMGDPGQARAGLPLETGPQLFSVQAKQLSGPADTLRVSFAVPADVPVKVSQVFAVSSDALTKDELCFAGASAPFDRFVNEIWQLTFPSKCLRSMEEILIFAVPVASDNHLTIAGAQFFNGDEFVGVTTNVKKLDWAKFPRLENLWLCTQPAAVPQCNSAAIFQVLGQPITSPEPKCVGFPNFQPEATCPRQELGSFEYEIRYDAKFLDVQLLALENGNLSTTTCVTNHREGIVNLACITKGKEHPILAPNILSLARITPKADVYSILTANQENGIATQLINQDCQLADLQGHPIPVEGLDVCQNGAVTIRYLEGDVHADCIVDVLDQQQIAFRWGSRLGNLLYNSRMDLEPSQPIKGDGDIDAKDLQFVYGRHGSSCHDAHPKQVPVDPKAK